MTNEEAILRLASDVDDSAAIVALAENNRNTLNAAISRYFPGRAWGSKALLTLLVRIARRAKYFLLGHDDADKWFEQCAEMECRRMKNETRSAAAFLN